MQLKIIATAIVSIGALGWILSPRHTSTLSVLEAQAEGMRHMIRTMMGEKPAPDSYRVSLTKQPIVEDDSCPCGCQDDNDYQYPGLHGLHSGGYER